MTKVHHEAKRFAGDDYDILLIGHEGHEEVEGTAGEAPEHIQLVQSPDDVAGHRRPRPAEGRLALADHAVGRRDDGDRRRDPASASRSCSTRRATTSATPPRTASWRSRRSAPSADLVIVVGSANSSNSVRLAEVALEAGAKAAYRVDDATEIDEAWLEGVETVSVTSGASVPEDLVDGVLAFLAERGYPDAQAVHTAEESLIFALPPELRRDLRKAAAARGRVRRWRATSTSTRSTRSRGRSPRSSTLLRDDALIAYPTDSGYALGIQLGNRDGLRPDPAAPRARRQAPLHAGLPGLRPARPARAPRQRGVPGDQGGDAGALHVHPAGDRRGAEAADAPEEAHRRRADPRPPGGLQALLEELGEPLLSSTLLLPGEDRADDRRLADQGGARPLVGRGDRLRGVRLGADHGRRLLRRAARGRRASARATRRASRPEPREHPLPDRRAPRARAA